MTHAELLRSHANLAIKEGGMYYSGEYLSGIATAAESLESENAKLRERADNLFNAVFAKNNELIDLLCENEKLRELVRDVYVLHWHGLDCTECPWLDECDTDGGCPWLGIMHDRMRELGVVTE